MTLNVHNWGAHSSCTQSRPIFDSGCPTFSPLVDFPMFICQQLASIMGIHSQKNPYLVSLKVKNWGSLWTSDLQNFRLILHNQILGLHFIVSRVNNSGQFLPLNVHNYRQLWKSGKPGLLEYMDPRWIWWKCMYLIPWNHHRVRICHYAILLRPRLLFILPNLLPTFWSPQQLAIHPLAFGLLFCSVGWLDKVLSWV